MTKERLEELIKQGATIYPDYGPAISLNAVKSPKVVEDIAGYELQFLSKNASVSVYINDLYETEKERDICVAQKEWVVKTHAERTERFEPPMWEDIENDFVFKFLVNDCLFRFYVDKDLCDIFGQPFDGDDCYLVSKPATKENYEKACEVVRDLFNKGGAK